MHIKLRGDAGFALPLLYEFCEFFDIQYALGIPANCVFQRRAEPRQKRLARRYRRTELPQRSFSSFRHRAGSWSRQRRICYKAEHTAAGTNLRFLITNCAGRASEIFAFYNDRGECENRIEEFKNGFHADRLSCHRFLAKPSACSCYGFAYNLVNLFRLPLPQPWRSAQIETLRARLFKIGARVRQTARCIRVHLASGWPCQTCSAPSPWPSTAVNPFPCFRILNSQSLVPAEPCSKFFLSGRDAELSRTQLRTSTTLPFKMPERTSAQTKSQS